ncbi:MAG: right-handed parallel beta-helix repeat-containing protein [Candidatus Kariarchaeaceae archaeon]
MSLSPIYPIEETDCPKEKSNLTEPSNVLIDRLFDSSLRKPKEISRRITSRPKIQVLQSNSDPIYIDDNSDFGPSGYFFPGNGTKVNPYLIEGLNFTHSSGTAIYIQGTSVHFIIRNNLLEGLETASTGIHLQSVVHGCIENNTIKDYYTNLIKISQSSNNTVKGNLLLDNIQGEHHTNGLFFEGSTQNTVIGNNISISHFMRAVAVSAFSHANIFSQNVILREDRNNFLISNSDNNTLYNNSLYIIELDTSDRNLIYGNSITESVNIGSLSDDNRIQINNFIYNAGANDGGSNNVFNYNYWSNWIDTPDTDPVDGILDVSYSIGGSSSNEDPYPISSHILAYLTPPIMIFPKEGDQISNIITIEWYNSLDFHNHEITYSLYFSNNSGQSWTLISEYQTSQEFDWNTTSLTNGINYKIQVIANCSDGKVATIVTNGTFSLQNHYLTTIIIDSPNNGDIFEGKVDVEWTGGEDSFGHQVSYSLFLSTNGGQNWTLIRVGLQNNHYSLDVMVYGNETNCKIMVQATCLEGLSINGISRGLFTIRELGNSTVNSDLINLLYIIIILLFVGVVLVVGYQVGKGIRYQIQFSHMKAGICLGSFSDRGFIMQWRSADCPFNEETLKHMIEYTAVMYQKGDYERFFGPFPQTALIRSKPSEWLFVSFGFQLVDESVVDPRIVKGGGKIPVILLIYYPKRFEFNFQEQKKKSEEYLSHEISKHTKVTELLSLNLRNIENFVLDIFYTR